LPAALYMHTSRKKAVPLMDDLINWVHTESCSACKGENINYRTRPWCQSCMSLKETLMKRGLLNRPPNRKPEPPIKILSTVDKIVAMHNAGISNHDIAQTLGLKGNTVSHCLWKANKLAGITREYKKREGC
jgi:hypothetical protein